MNLTPRNLMPLLLCCFGSSDDDILIVTPSDHIIDNMDSYSKPLLKQQVWLRKVIL
jgi:mannose-1-phosphate guanylyltransferase